MAAVAEAVRGLVDGSVSSVSSGIDTVGDSDSVGNIVSGSDGLQKKYTETQEMLADVQTIAKKKLSNLLQQLRLVCHAQTYKLLQFNYTEKFHN